MLFALKGGPIVEQGTHFIDLMRFLSADRGGGVGGAECADVDSFSADYDASTLNVLCGAGEDARNALVLSTDSFYAMDRAKRNPIVTQCQFRMRGGEQSIVSFAHSTSLHHKKYRTQMQVVLDGLHLEIVDLYQRKSRLRVRESSLSRHVQCTEFELVFDAERDEQDPYYLELLHFFANVVARGKEAAQRTPIYSDYTDAFKTYLLSFHIKLKSRDNLSKL